MNILPFNNCVYLYDAAGVSDQESTTSSDQSCDVAGGSSQQQQQPVGDRSSLLAAINSFNKTSLRQTKSVDGAVPQQDVGS